MKHILATLATWRLTILIQREDAPFDALKRFREHVNLERASNYFGVDNVPLKANIYEEIGQAIECDYCLSVWCGLFVALCTKQNLIYALAYSIGALIVQSVFKEV